MSDKKSCGCSIATKLIFPCSGCSDVGELSDQASRKATKEGVGKMSCLAGIGGRLSGFIQSTKAASKVIAIDGCQLNCAQKTLLEAGFNDFEHLIITEVGYKKNETIVNEHSINDVANKIKNLLAC